MNKPLIDIRNLSKHFDRGRHKIRAVDDVSLSIEAGEIVGLVGESGSGKSTLGSTLLGLDRKTAGEIFYKGSKLPTVYRAKDFHRYARSMQMIFQDPYSSLNPRMTAGEIIGEALRLHSDLNKSDIAKRIEEWLVKVGLNTDHLGRYPHEFSGGQRQRIGIARALILEPDFVVCDEPISALDVSVQAQIVDLLGELKRSLGLTLLFIAHDLSMVRYVSDRMAVMYLGSLVEIGRSDRVFFDPKHPYTELLIGSNPEPDPNQERSRQKVQSIGEIPSQLDIPTGCRFANRCPHAMAICHDVNPVLRIVSHEDDKRLVACHLYE